MPEYAITIKSAKDQERLTNWLNIVENIPLAQAKAIVQYHLPLTLCWFDLVKKDDWHRQLTPLADIDVAERPTEQDRVLTAFGDELDEARCWYTMLPDKQKRFVDILKCGTA